jgi:hypothetical protein
MNNEIHWIDNEQKGRYPKTIYDVILMFIPAIIIGVILYLLIKDIIFLILTLIIGILFTFLPYSIYSRYWHYTPIQIADGDKGLLLRYRNNNQRNIPWENISAILIVDVGRYEKRIIGVLKDENGEHIKGVVINPPACYEVQRWIQRNKDKADTSDS